MTRHLADHGHAVANGRVRDFTRHERESGLHPAVATLHRRPHGRDEDVNRRTAEYLRIARGHSA